MRPNQIALALLAAIIGVGALLSVVISQNPVTNIATVPPQTQVAQVTQSITMGETNSTLTQQDDHGDAGNLIGQQFTLSQTATIQSLSFYVTTPSGKLRLGVYDSSGAKVAETNEITPVTGWNTSPVTARSLTAGTYWLTYLTNDSNLYFPWSTSGSYKSAPYTYGAMPSTFPSSTPGTGHAAIYATLNYTTTPSTPSTPTTPTTPSTPPATTTYPPVITGVAVPTVSSTGATITWMTNIPADTQVYYGLTNERFSSNYNSHTALDSTLSTSHSVTLTGLTPNTMYYFQVRSTANSQTGKIAQQFTTAPTATPVVTPTINTFTITPSTLVRGQSATLSWTTTGLTSCNIESTGNNYLQQIFGSTLGVVKGANDSITVTIPSTVGFKDRGTTSYLQLGCYTSQLPNITGTYVYKTVTVTIPAGSTQTGDTTPPSTPTNLRVTSVTSSQVNLSWTASTDNSGTAPKYILYRNGVSYDPNVTGTTYQNANLNPSTSYSYTVAAYDAANNTSPQSTSVSTTTRPVAADVLAPTVTSFTIPATLTVSSVPASVPISTFTATDAVGVTGYLLTESLTPTPTTATAGWTTSIPASYTFATAGAKTLYAWAKDAAGNVSSSKSAAVTVTLGPVSTKFTLNQQVQANAQVNVRSTAGNTTSLGTQALNAIGTVIGGPVAALLSGVSYIWWNITFPSSPSGWVAENYLDTYTAPVNPAPTISSFFATPTAITSGQSSTLTWSSTNAIACTGTGGTFTGSRTASNLQSTLVVTPTVTTTYSLTCTGATGTSPATASVTVTVGTLSSGNNWFVKPSGTGGGTSWNDAAGPSTISSKAIIAGDTVWLAGGNTYTTSMTFSKSGTASAPIYIKRATSNDAAAVNAAGWQAAYDSTVTFQVAATGAADQAAVTITGSYVTFDGNTPNGSYGVKVIMGLGKGQAWNAFRITGSHITITHTETQGRDPGLPAGATTRYLAMYGTYNTSTYNFVHNVTQAYTLNGSNDMTIDHDIVKDNGWHSDIDLAHDDMMEYTGSTRLTVRYSTWEHWHAEGIMAWGGFGQAGTIWMYGNIFKTTGVSVVWPSSNGQTTAGPLYFYNNTIIDGYVCLNQSANVPWASGSVSRNNIYWGTDVYGGPWNWSNGITRDHEFGSTANLAGNGTGSISNGSNPFVNAAAGDYHIIGTVGATYPRNKGATVTVVSGQTFNIDRDGTSRDADGTWDIGAYEFH